MLKNCAQLKNIFYLCPAFASPSGEMVDTLVSGASASRRVGSTPISGTKKRLAKSQLTLASLFLFRDFPFFIGLAYHPMEMFSAIISISLSLASVAAQAI